MDGDNALTYENGKRGIGYKVGEDIIIPQKEVLKVVHKPGVSWWLLQDDDKTFRAIELKSGWTVSGKHKTLDAASANAEEMYSKYRIAFEALSSRILHGQEGVVNEPKDLFTYGILK